MGFTRHKRVADVEYKYLFLYDFNLKYTRIDMNSGAVECIKLEHLFVLFVAFWVTGLGAGFQVRS